MSNAQTHLWHMGEKSPATPWETELDQLAVCRSRWSLPAIQQRKKLYDRVQELLAQQLPVVYLVCPNISGRRAGETSVISVRQSLNSILSGTQTNFFGTPPPENTKIDGRKRQGNINIYTP